MKMLIKLLGVLVMFATVHQAVSQGTRFFRVSGPAATAIIAFKPDGTLIWSNALSGTNYIVQTISLLSDKTNWVDYVQLPVTNAVSTNLLIVFHPPANMVFIPAGVFTMGDTLDNESDAVPMTNVNVSAFYMDVNLVSYGQWQSIYIYATNHGYSFTNVGLGKALDHPVYDVNWYDCVKWSNARSQQAGLTPIYYTDASLTHIYTNGETTNIFVNWSADGYRLPTEAEWEKAARGGLSGHRFPWGDMISETLANYAGATYLFSYDLGPNGYNVFFVTGAQPYTSPIGFFAANGYGLFDMAGNLGEWCWDWFGTPYIGGNNPHGPVSGNYRVLRSSGWNNPASSQRCSFRFFNDPTFNFSSPAENVGFRCVRGL
jgi:formylglycine-generating enzyme required for sulfatase activity